MSEIITELDKIINFNASKTNNSSFTKAFINEHSGEIPVYGASLDPNEVSYGYVEDNLPQVKYFNNCLTWNIDGSPGAFFRKGHFSLSEKVIPLIPFDNLKDTIDLIYLKYMIMSSKEFREFNFSNKAGKNKLKKVNIKIPIRPDGSYDLSKQKELAQKYKDIEDKKKDLLDKIDELKKYKIVFDDNETDYSEVKISDLFTPKNGSSKYTKEWCKNHTGTIRECKLFCVNLLDDVEISDC